MKRLPKPQVYTQKHKPDMTILSLVILLTLFGLLMVYDASSVQAYQNYQDKYYFIKQQLLWVVLGLAAMFVFSLFDYQKLKKIAMPAFLASLVLLLLPFVPGLGVSAGGAHRWLKISSFTIQPAEMVKLTSIIFFAALFEKRVRTLPLLLVFSLVSVIVGIFQKDLGSTIVYAITTLGVYFISGAPLKYFTALLPLTLSGAVFFIMSSPYRQKRVLAFLDPFADPSGFTYHISQVLIALGSGGFWGAGLGQSRQKFNFIPEVTTDSIFAVIGEELGFVGSLILIAILGAVIIKGFKVASRAADNFGKIIAGGITIWLGTQAIVNLSAMASLIPLTGVPLPFISYGGSALLTNLVAVGILLNISKSTKV